MDQKNETISPLFQNESWDLLSFPKRCGYVFSCDNLTGSDHHI